MTYGHFISDGGFEISEERVAQEGSRVYCIIKTVPFGGKALTETEKHFGPCLIKDRNAPNVQKYFAHNIAILEDILRGMESAGDTKGERYIKIREVLDGAGNIL